LNREELISALHWVGPDHVYEFRMLHALLAHADLDLQVDTSALPGIAQELSWKLDYVRKVVQHLSDHCWLSESDDGLQIIAPIRLI
jgi:hypothetical protein